MGKLCFSVDSCSMCLYSYILWTEKTRLRHVYSYFLWMKKTYCCGMCLYSYITLLRIFLHVTGSEEKIVICEASTVPMLFCSGTVIHQHHCDFSDSKIEHVLGHAPNSANLLLLNVRTIPMKYLQLALIHKWKNYPTSEPVKSNGSKMTRWQVAIYTKWYFYDKDCHAKNP